jgi:DNA-binding NarL/FixJ family response regulator
VCRALRVLCAAPTAERLTELKRATASAHWEIVGGARTIEGLVEQMDGSRPDVVVIDVELGPEAVRAVRETRPAARIVTVGGELEGADGWADLDALRQTIHGGPPVGGPVRS